jgi:dUTP pyrophosphatase
MTACRHRRKPMPALVPELLILPLPHGDGLELPAYETSGAAGMDLRAAVDRGRSRLSLRPAPAPPSPPGW